MRNREKWGTSKQDKNLGLKSAYIHNGTFMYVSLATF